MTPYLPAAARLRLMFRKDRHLRAVQPPRPPKSPRQINPAFRVALRQATPDLIELGFVLVLVTGVGAIFWPAALILFGMLGVVACERRSALTTRAERAQARRATERAA